MLDADVYGPSIPKMMNLEGPVNINKRKNTFDLYPSGIQSTIAMSASEHSSCNSDFFSRLEI